MLFPANAGVILLGTRLEMVLKAIPRECGGDPLIIKPHDLELSRDVLKSKMLKPEDILINDRGVISRELLSKLKYERQLDTYIPLKKHGDL